MNGSEAPAVSLNHPQTVNLSVDLRIFNKVITDGRLIVCQRWLLCDVPYYVVRNKSQHGHLTDESNHEFKLISPCGQLWRPAFVNRNTDTV